MKKPEDLKKCTECGRLLNEDENDLCPACKSTKSYKQKRWGEIIVGVAGVAIMVVGVAAKVLTDSKGD